MTSQLSLSLIWEDALQIVKEDVHLCCGGCLYLHLHDVCDDGGLHGHSELLTPEAMLQLLFNVQVRHASHATCTLCRSTLLLQYGSIIDAGFCLCACWNAACETKPSGPARHAIMQHAA